MLPMIVRIKSAHDRADEPAAPAEEANAADHRGSDRGEDVILPYGGRPGAGLGRQVKGSKGREGAGQAIGEEIDGER